MIDFDEFGKRICQLRKSRGMTQEELAGRLGISGQAVSKWENGTSYPDVALFPTLATIFQTSIDALFGVEKEVHTTSASLPERYEGLPLVHQYENVGCYSTKGIKSIDGSGVVFVDGSTAELSTRMVVNNGTGNLFTIEMDSFNYGYGKNLDYSKNTAEFEFDFTNALSVVVLSNRVEVRKSPDNKTRVRAKGHPVFIEHLEALVTDDILHIRFKEQDDREMRGFDENAVFIEVPYDRGETVDLQINGSGVYDGSIFYKKGSLSINGSGIVKAVDFGDVVVRINGSGEVVLRNAESADLCINGSGEIKFDHIKEPRIVINGSGDAAGNEAGALSIHINGSGDAKVSALAGGDLTAAIGGSGDIKIGGGRCGRFEARIDGSGSIDAEHVTAKTAVIQIDQNGEVVLGAVLGSSTEQVKKKGKIRILKRGEEA